MKGGHCRDRIAAFSERGNDAFIGDQGVQRRQHKGTGCRALWARLRGDYRAGYLIRVAIQRLAGTKTPRFINSAPRL